MEEFGVIFSLFFFYLIFIAPIRLILKKGKQSGKKISWPKTPGKPTAQQQTAGKNEPAAESLQEAAAAELIQDAEQHSAGERTPEERRPFAEWSEPYRGSLDTVTLEGEDPCHEEQMESLKPEPEAAVQAAPASGIGLSWTGNEIVKGFVMSEILKRKV